MYRLSMIRLLFFMKKNLFFIIMPHQKTIYSTKLKKKKCKLKFFK